MFNTPPSYGSSIRLAPGTKPLRIEYDDRRGVDRDVDAVKQRLALGYSSAAPVYDATAGHLYLNGLKHLLARIRPRRWPSVLDVGCGTGINLLATANALHPTRLLCGIDLSPGMVETARQKAAARGIPAHFIVGDAERLPFADGTFDLIICNSVLHWFTDRAAAIREMARVLSPGGQVALICAAAPGFSEWFALVDVLLPAVGAPPLGQTLPALPTAAEVGGLLQAADLQIDHLAQPVQVQRIRDASAFVRLMLTVAPNLAADLTPAQLQAFEQLAAATIRQQFPNGFPCTWAAVEATATKL